MNRSLLSSAIPLARTRKLILPDLPEEKWSDFRREYESGMTIKSIAELHFCDPRTVRMFLHLNRNSWEIGHQRAPTILVPWMSEIHRLYTEWNDGHIGICQISHRISLQLKATGYTGSERSIRNYLREQYFHIEERQNESSENCTR